MSSARPSRLAVAVLLALGLVLAGADPAAAHVEATAGPGAQAGAGPVTVAFEAAAESPGAGIAGVATQLPAGVAPASVSLSAGPAGWTLTPTADGYEIGGPALAPGTDATYAITVEQLPADRTEFVFKTIVRYTDGTEDAWIEEPTPNDPEPGNPAPTITVAAAPAPASSSASAPATSATTPDAPASPTENRAGGEPAADDGGVPAWVITLAVPAAVAVAVVVALVRRRNREAGTGPTG